MTYNFDPDKWYENEIAFLEKRYKSGEISEQEYKEASEKLGKRHVAPIRWNLSNPTLI